MFARSIVLLCCTCHCLWCNERYVLVLFLAIFAMVEMKGHECCILLLYQELHDGCCSWYLLRNKHLSICSVSWHNAKPIYKIYQVMLHPILLWLIFAPDKVRYKAMIYTHFTDCAPNDIYEHKALYVIFIKDILIVYIWKLWILHTTSHQGT